MSGFSVRKTVIVPDEPGAEDGRVGEQRRPDDQRGRKEAACGARALRGLAHARPAVFSARAQPLRRMAVPRPRTVAVRCLHLVHNEGPLQRIALSFEKTWKEGASGQ